MVAEVAEVAYISGWGDLGVYFGSYIKVYVCLSSLVAKVAKYPG